MKISRFNKIMAIKRHPEFKKDYEAYTKLKRPAKRLQRAIEIEKKFGEPIERIINAEKLKDRIKPNCIQEVRDIYEKPMQIISIREGEKIVRREIDGERLYLKVDILDTKENLDKAFKEIINCYQKISPPPNRKKRDRKHLIDIWKVYDMHHEENLNFLQIARKLSKIKGNPSYNSKLMGWYKAVERAYRKAKETIEIVDA